ncbi:MAG: hypothetical protein K1X54_12825 [Flavobacteriales bacterium]|nr:hypothetical protein [Flavobacteriales bacterium]
MDLFYHYAKFILNQYGFRRLLLTIRNSSGLDDIPTQIPWRWKWPLTLALFFGQIIHAQVSTKYTYTPNATSASYTAISSGTTICSGANVSGTTSNAYYQGGAANTPSSGIPIGFTFKYNCVDYTTLGVHTNGFLWFGTGVPAAATTLTIGNASANLGGSGTIDGLIACWAGSVASTPRIPVGATSYIRYTTSGSSPNRIFKIEWGGYKMTGSFNGTGLIPSSQIWLYETSNNIEMYFNNQSSILINGTRSGQIGLRGTSNTDFKTLNGGTTGWTNIPAGTTNSQVVSTSSSPAFYPTAHRVLAFNFTGSCCTPPSTPSSSLSFSSITTSSVTLNWTNGNGSSRVVVARQTSAVNTAPSTGTDYTAGANATFGSGTLLGSGNYVVYAGTGNSVVVSGLTGGQTYHFAVYESSATFCYTNTAATGSQAIPLCFPPTIAATSLNATSVNTTSMDVNWTRGDGDAGIMIVARLTSTASVAPVSGTTYTTTTFGTGSGNQLTGAGNYVVYVGTGNTVNVTNLLPSTSYTFSAYEYNAAGTCYGSAATLAQTTASCSPSTDASGLVVSGILNNAATLTFTRGSGSRVLVVARATATANASPVYNTSYTANTVFGSGSTTGTGNYVVYDGTGNTVSITGLSQVTSYTFVVYEYQDSPNCYSISPASTSFTTLDPTMGSTTPTLACGYTFSGVAGFSTITATAGKVLIASGAIDNVNYPSQNISTYTNGSGFLFSYNGVDYSSFGISSNGYIWFGTGSPSVTTYNPIGNASSNLGGTGTIEGVISACGTDLVNHAYLSSTPTPTQINAVVTGTAPNRVLTIEWSGFVAKAVSASYTCNFLLAYMDESRLDFQIKLYEKGGSAGNRIELSYRDQTAFCVNDAYTFQAGLRGSTNADYNCRSKSAAGQMTTSSTTNGGTSAATISLGTSYISGNVTFRFNNTLSAPVISPSGTAANVCPSNTVSLSSSVGSNYQWFRNSSLVPGPGSSSQTVNADQSGNYTVTVSSGGCYISSLPVAVTIVPCNVNITASSGSGGSISPTGIVSVPYNTNQAFTITPNCGFQIADVLVDGVSVGPVSTYTFSSVIVTHTIQASFVAANEMCGNAIDDDCDGSTDEGCVPAFYGDTPNTSLIISYSVNVAYPNCYPINGDLSGAGDSPESVTFTGPDQWFTFVAQSTGITISMFSNTMDNAIGLYTKSGSNYILFDSENANPAGVGGFERLSNNTLTPGVQYYVSVGAASGVTGGTFTTCIQHLMPSGCSFTQPPGGFNLCSNYKAIYRGAQSNGVSYDFTFEGVGGGASGTTSLLGTNGLIVLSNTLLQLRYGGVYDIKVDVKYNLLNGSGGYDNLLVLGTTASANCNDVQMMPQPLNEVKLSQRCPSVLLRSNYLIGTPLAGSSSICGTINYTFEFTQLSSCGGSTIGFPIEYTTQTSTPYLPLGNLASLPNTGHWRVRIRPNFTSGNGVYGPYQDISVNGTSVSVLAPDEIFSDPLKRQESSSMQFAVFPNPNHGDMLQLNVTDITDEVIDVAIYNAVGELIGKRSFVAENTLNVVWPFESLLPGGLYLIECRNAGRVIRESFMVQ